ncbi:hypothetical protein SAMN05216264_101247 [Pseudomonas marincola]|jgi:hypothetical protein|nr:hypothetical protein SAMN05216264_101247 [Pseudomonas marincola]
MALNSCAGLRSCSVEHAASILTDSTDFMN